MASFLPIMLIAVLFGLAMDYEVFLVSGMREEWIRTGQARPAITQGARHASRVVTAAALIMLSVFASFVTTEDAILKPIAFALAFGVVIDAFLIRMTFVPAVLTLARGGAWWLPRWLDKILPNLDIEGQRLQHAAEPAPDPAYGVQPGSPNGRAQPRGGPAGLDAAMVEFSPVGDGPAVAGQVQGPHQRAVAGAVLTGTDFASHQVAHGVSDADGGYRLDGQGGVEPVESPGPRRPTEPGSPGERRYPG